jgi:hypothetical protein
LEFDSVHELFGDIDSFVSTERIASGGPCRR